MKGLYAMWWAYGEAKRVYGGGEVRRAESKNLFDWRLEISAQQMDGESIATELN